MNTHSSNGYGRSSSHDISVWWFRWHEYAKPGKWLATVMTFGSEILECVDCVVDDFGNLVGVKE